MLLEIKRHLQIRSHLWVADALDGNPIIQMPIVFQQSEEWIPSVGSSLTAQECVHIANQDDATTCSNWAQKTSHEPWEKIGLGGIAYKALAYPSAKSNSNAPESIAEKTKKAINFIGPYVNSSLEEREIFYLHYGGLLKRYNFYLKFIVLIMILI